MAALSFFREMSVMIEERFSWDKMQKIGEANMRLEILTPILFNSTDILIHIQSNIKVSSSNLMRNS